MTRRLLVVLCATLLPLPAPAEEALGRLFFTPEKRAALERSRKLNLRQAQQEEGATLSLDGVVKRSSGRDTVWINGRPHDLSLPQQGVTVTIGSDAADATVRLGEEAPARLRVGQALDRDTGERHDGLRGGRLATKPSRP